MQTLAGLLLALILVAFLSAVADGRGAEWLRSKFMGRPGGSDPLPFRETTPGDGSDAGGGTIPGRPAPGQFGNR